ncbi:pollen-specific leucine-rich repeat extensin-like protein 2 isoform X2 [Agrilus planipennis]|uniref:Pollen-specific leucine-rich repeat extensin-like protein 2 isoform X2 n=1 Tax=Agrilus planipennis TaxID=224129 RepID=A0A7F5RKA0_AGRPL|nr:pollen-specific leucine-rich repeat extensin-like protein 2 isoform X2 [Agrilus planipennis]
MISASLEGRLSYMTYPEPWGGPPKQPPEFLRPAPKPLSQASKYNGVTISTNANGARLLTSQRPTVGKYPSSTTTAPVNLTSSSQQSPLKEEPVDDLAYNAYSRLFPPPPHTFAHYPSPYAIYQSPYTPLLPRNFAPPPPLSPLETPPYTPTTPSVAATTGATFLSPSATFSPPVLSKTSPQQQQQHQQQQHGTVVVTSTSASSPGFKIPSGKEGSLKHRILTRPGDIPKSVTSLQKTLSVADSTPTPAYHHSARVSPQLPSVLPEVSATPHNRKRLSAAFSPPSSPAATTKPLLTNNIASANNNVLPINSFVKGALIQLANGTLRRIEEMQTEDFVQSAEKSAELRLADSTVVKIEETPSAGTVTIKLSYNQRRAQVEFESAAEHPFFVYGRGWASFAPERTLQVFGLKVHRLQVGDVLISLTPREPSCSSTSFSSSSIITTATTTAPTPRQFQQHQQSSANIHMLHHHHHQQQQGNSSSTNAPTPMTVSISSSNSSGGHQPGYSHNSHYHLTGNSGSSNSSSNLLNLVISNSNNNNNVKPMNSSCSNYYHMNASNTHLSGSHSYIMSNQRLSNSHSQPNQTVSELIESDASKKRRWSAPDEICDDDDELQTSSSSKKVKLQ